METLRSGASYCYNKVSQNKMKCYMFYLLLGCIAQVAVLGAVKSGHIEKFESYTSGHQRQSFQSNLPCNSSFACGQNAECAQDGPNSFYCRCIKGWVNRDGQTCVYRQRDGLTALLLSIFVGGLGVDWFYLSCGIGGYIAAGVFKLLTVGGLGIWWVVDIIRIACGVFWDGNGIPLSPI